VSRYAPSSCRLQQAVGVADAGEKGELAMAEPSVCAIEVVPFCDDVSALCNICLDAYPNAVRRHSLPQHRAPCCNTVQPAATQCTVLQHCTTCRNTVHRVATQYNLLRHSSARCATAAAAWTAIPSSARRARASLVLPARQPTAAQC
jgi:hypothetical protein